MKRSTLDKLFPRRIKVGFSLNVQFLQCSGCQGNFLTPWSCLFRGSSLFYTSLTAILDKLQPLLQYRRTSISLVAPQLYGEECKLSCFSRRTCLAVVNMHSDSRTCPLLQHKGCEEIFSDWRCSTFLIAPPASGIPSGTHESALWVPSTMRHA